MNKECSKCEGRGVRVPDDCYCGKVNPEATQVQDWVYDCNICPHEQPCMVPCECLQGKAKKQ